jgi:hypothetical protein
MIKNMTSKAGTIAMLTISPHKGKKSPIKFADKNTIAQIACA